MTASTDHAASIRWRLFGTLFVPAAAVLIAGTVTTYLTVVPPFIDAYDQALLESALAIAAHVKPASDGRLELSLPPDALAIVRADSKDSVFFRVTAADEVGCEPGSHECQPHGVPDQRVVFNDQHAHERVLRRRTRPK